MVRNLKQLHKLKFEAVTIPSVGSNDTNRTVHELSAGTAGLKFEDVMVRGWEFHNLEDL